MHHDLAAFESMVYADLEKAYDSTIACCDECYDEFLKFWPWADKADDYEFQKRGIDLKWFYDNGRVKDLWSEEEYWALMDELGCPRCLAPLKGTIWAYELPFDARDLEDEIFEVSELARQTPFLLLENEFCQRIYSAIKETAKHVFPSHMGHPLYRARIKNNGLQHLITEFDFPPPQYVGEGRYNHAGNPVLYLASDLKTCKAEVRAENVLTLEFELTQPLKIFDLTSEFYEIREYEDLLRCLVYSALISAPQAEDGLYKPHYTVSRFVADCARSAGFDAIKYPSTRSASGSFNLVLVNQKLRLEQISKNIKYIESPA